MYPVCKVCSGMSKQSYLLAIGMVLISVCLGAEINLQSGFYSADTGNETTFLSKNRLDAEFTISPFVQLKIGSKAETSDFAIDNFPQNRWVNNYMAVSYGGEILKAEAGYRNILFGASQNMQLYPRWNPVTDFRRNAQHQVMLNLDAEYAGFVIDGYVATKNLLANPIEYTYDFVTDTNVPNMLPSKSHDELYAGAGIAFQLHPSITLGGGYGHKQSNFTDSDVYNSSEYFLYSQAEHKLSPSSRISGSINWKHINGEAIRDEARNNLLSSIRYQQSFGFGLNGFVSFMNDICSDDQVKQVWLVSNYIRSHLQYHFGYDPVGASYLLAGAVIVPEKESETWFVESNMHLIGNVYGNTGYSYRKNLENYYQIKLSYFFNHFSECYLQSFVKDLAGNKDLQSYYGLGVSIRL